MDTMNTTMLMVGSGEEVTGTLKGDILVVEKDRYTGECEVFKVGEEVTPKPFDSLAMCDTDAERAEWNKTKAQAAELVNELNKYVAACGAVLSMTRKVKR